MSSGAREVRLEGHAPRDHWSGAPVNVNTRGAPAKDRAQKERHALRKRLRSAEDEVEELKMRLDRSHERERAMRKDIVALQDARVADKEKRYTFE